VPATFEKVQRARLVSEVFLPAPPICGRTFLKSEDFKKSCGAALKSRARFQSLLLMGATAGHF
jgi:hypothetical protein